MAKLKALKGTEFGDQVIRLVQTLDRETGIALPLTWSAIAANHIVASGRCSWSRSGMFFEIFAAEFPLTTEYKCPIHFMFVGPRGYSQVCKHVILERTNQAVLLPTRQVIGRISTRLKKPDPSIVVDGNHF